MEGESVFPVYSVVEARPEDVKVSIHVLTK